MSGNRILVVRGGAIGDFVLTLPVLAALRRQFPQAHLEVTLKLDPAHGGSGQLFDTTGAKPLQIGTLSWLASGLATISLDDGTSFKATLF